MKHTSIAIVAALCATLGLGCATAGSTDGGDPSRVERSQIDRVKNRAAFDLQCQRAQIEVQTIYFFSRAAIDDDTNSVYGVTGCGQRATYIVHTVHGPPILDHLWSADGSASQAFPAVPVASDGLGDVL